MESRNGTGEPIFRAGIAMQMSRIVEQTWLGSGAGDKLGDEDWTYIHKPCTKQIASGNQLYSTGSSAETVVT